SVDGIRLSCMQFYIAGAICLVGMFLKEQPVFTDILAAAVPILYAGVMSCGAAYTLQITGQLHADPAVASILLSLESVFALLAGFIILHQVLSIREVTGCVLMFAAIMLAQKS
ncbi:MAG: EamA family transporter, partial [Erysipelotrichaceae bacterium]|nr:EamA family transporter [Erysipelotrichaceae bacterium]